MAIDDEKDPLLDNYGTCKKLILVFPLQVIFLNTLKNKCAQ